MPWQIPLLLNVLIAYVANPTAIKKSVGLPGRTSRLALMFLGNMLVSGVLVLVFARDEAWDWSYLWIVGVGLLNSAACYAHWRASDLSLSGTSIMARFDDLIAMSLGYYFLEETQLFNPVIVFGIVLCIGCATGFSLIKSQEPDAPQLGFKFIKWVLLYSTLWGIAVFSMRAFGLAGVPTLIFLLHWYGGSFLGSLVIATVMGKKEWEGGINRQGLFWVLILCTTSLSGLGVTYWVKTLAPLTVVQPILQVSEMILLTLVGFFLFKEVNAIDWRGRLLFAGGVVGGLILVISYN